MDTFPDFSAYHYQVEQELGQNRAGGRVTYLATDLRTRQPVVIKQFQFARSDSTWLNYDAYDREIQLLKQLDHPGIPRYLDSFQTADGFCMVQEYKPATALSTSRSFSPAEVQQIAVKALEVLVYLQSLTPPIIHRDIKPENILVNEAREVYLVDFGFARIGEGEVGVSSVVKGTLGFMPPEQLFNRQLTEASDLYGLGMTLICLLTNRKSDQIGDLVDISYRVSFKHLVPKLSPQWVNWLEKMVEPRLKDRFPNAATALAALPIADLHPPEAQFSHSQLEFHAGRLGQQLTQAITITNSVPDTLLEGHWEVAAHPNDPVTELYCWIAVDPKTFKGNRVNCQITVDTSKLMAGKTYQRKLLLHANTQAKVYSVNLHIHTPRLPIQPGLFSYGLLAGLGLFSLIISWLISWVILVMGTVAGSADAASLGAVVGAAIGLEGAAWLMQSSGWRTGASASTLAAVGLGGAFLTQVLFGSFSSMGSSVILGAVIGAVGGAIAGIAMGLVVEKLLTRGCKKRLALASTILMTLLGSSLGVCFSMGFGHAVGLWVLVTSGLGLGVCLTQLLPKSNAAIFPIRKMGGLLIKP